LIKILLKSWILHTFKSLNNISSTCFDLIKSSSAADTTD